VSPDKGRDRTVTVPAERLTGWVRGFAERHGDVTAVPTVTGFDLQAQDGSRAHLFATGAPVPLPAAGEERDPQVLAATVAAHLLAEREIALLVVRRGGYAAARIRGTQIMTSKVGSRYVQGRTAAGGWSQHRFARRRDNQTSELVGASVEVAARILGTAPGGRQDGEPAPEVLVTGGDRALIDRALTDPRLRDLTRLPRGPHLALGDPRADVVRSVPAMLRSVRITLTG
jgi:hypothetical protein